LRRKRKIAKQVEGQVSIQAELARLRAEVERLRRGSTQSADDVIVLSENPNENPALGTSPAQSTLIELTE